MTTGSARRMLLVHAHPDDETITTGATMAAYAAAGVAVTLLTCTLGEEGEILVPEYAHLAAAEADQLGGVRIGELDAAMRALGVADHHYLGGAGRFRDSGMAGTPSTDHPRAFWRAATDPDVFDAAVDAAVAVVREVRPQVVVTYDENGDYGHPDHVMAHRVTTAAVERAADPDHAPGLGPAWTVPKLYWTATPTSLLQRGADGMRTADDPPFAAADDFGFGVDDDVVTATVDATTQLDAKTAALRAHATQVAVSGPWFALTNMLGREINGVEHYRLVRGMPGDDCDADGRERDLFAGVTDGR